MVQLRVATPYFETRSLHFFLQRGVITILYPLPLSIAKQSSDSNVCILAFDNSDTGNASQPSLSWLS